MKIPLSLALMFALASHALAAEPTAPAAVPETRAIAPPPGADLTVFPRAGVDVATVSLSRVTVSDFLALVYGEVFKTPYIIDPALVADTRVMSTRLEVSKKSRSQLKALFESLELKVESRNGVDFISKREVPKESEKEVFLYVPKHREASYFIDLFRNLFGGQFTVTRPVQAPQGVTPPAEAPAGSAASLMDSRSHDVIVFSGTAKEVAQIKKLFAQVDVKAGEVLLRATVFEVNTSSSDASGFQLAMNLLSSKLQLSIGSAPAGGNAVQFRTPAIEAVFSALASDGRFKTLSSPSIRVRSGGTGHFAVGQDVPVLGAVTYAGAGAQPVQSVEYRSSGVIFDVKPMVYADSVDLDVMQQISSFANTRTGVNGSPTLIKRELRTVLSLTDGEVVVLGGLSESKESQGKSGQAFLPRFFDSKTSDTAQTEIILVLQMQKI